MGAGAVLPLLLLAAAAAAGAAAAGGAAAGGPPMGWMSWERFRCHRADAGNVTAALYEAQAAALVDRGFAAVGYDRVHEDDCWTRFGRGRDADGRLAADGERFPGGIASLAGRLAALGVKLGLYADEGSATCQMYAGSAGREAEDAATFADWGADYLKVDGCNSSPEGFECGYPRFGEALGPEGITFSCSWPAYLGDDETKKPYGAMVAAGCDLYRNWDDLQCSWESLQRVVDHYGDYGEFLAKATPPGVWNDPDVLLVGNDCITMGEARLQVAVWAVLAAPFIMGNDLTTIEPWAQQLLQNPALLGIVKDPAGLKGWRRTVKQVTEAWSRPLANGDMAVGVIRKGEAGAPDVHASFDLLELGFPMPVAEVFDVFNEEHTGNAKGRLVAQVPARDARLFRVSQHLSPQGELPQARGGPRKLLPGAPRGAP